VEEIPGEQKLGWMMLCFRAFGLNQTLNWRLVLQAACGSTMLCFQEFELN
jgi:hypothetical protein